MKTARYGVESISIMCPECFEYLSAGDGSQQFTEYDVDRLKRVLECPACGEKFLKPKYPEQRKVVAHG